MHPTYMGTRSPSQEEHDKFRNNMMPPAGERIHLYPKGDASLGRIRSPTQVVTPVERLITDPAAGKTIDYPLIYVDEQRLRNDPDHLAGYQRSASLENTLAHHIPEYQDKEIHFRETNNKMKNN